jgi:hypothetical protein
MGTLRAPSLVRRWMCLGILLLVPGIVRAQDAKTFEELTFGPDYNYEDNIQYQVGNQSIATLVPVRVTPMTGSCHDYSATILTPTETAKFGQTKFTLRHNLHEPVYSSRFECPCNNRLYDDVAVCADKCQPSLGCFVGICQPQQPRVCRTRVDQCTEVVPEWIHVVLWKPANPVDQTLQCQAVADTMNSAILAHEEAHVSSNAQFGASRLQREERATSCGSTLADVDHQNEMKLDVFDAACTAAFFGIGVPSNPANPDNPHSNPASASQFQCGSCP